ncbi:DUF1853 family protein [Hanstruepera neustonica]|nr:DUF1853 family protein [Hanstruepera neustonica]
MDTLTSQQQQLQLQYQGFIQTQPLWFGQLNNNLQQFGLMALQDSVPLHPQDAPKRLGNRVEYFVFQSLAQQAHIKILETNLQIQQDKQTLGELDALLLVNNQPIHLEIIYKFYVYDPLVGTTDLEHWIGPNRKDSLVYKLDKLRNKQLPLLQAPETQPYLERHRLDSASIKQEVLFLAQLFVPRATATAVPFEQLNAKAVMGTYVRLPDLETYTTCSLYIPNKLDWLVLAHNTVSWQPYTLIKSQLEALLQTKRAPLIWMRHPDGQLERLFVVWW